MPDVVSNLEFLQWQDLYEKEKPYELFIDLPDELATKLKQTNCKFTKVDHTIHDVRGIEDTLSLDANGFIFRKYPTILSETDLLSRDSVDRVYLPEVESILRKEVVGVDRVFFFDWRLRKFQPEAPAGNINLNDKTQYLRPAVEMHVDQSPAATLKRIQLQLPEDAEFLLKGRVRIFNVWRPLVSAIKDWPIAVCDGSTVVSSDLVETDNVRKHYAGSTMYLMSRESQKWYYMSEQGCNDVLIFKTFDSDPNVQSRATPHGAFKLEDCGDVEPRSSIEARALVFTYAS